MDTASSDREVDGDNVDWVTGRDGTGLEILISK